MSIRFLGDKRYNKHNKYTFDRIKRPPINAPVVKYTISEQNPSIDLSTINPQFKYNFVYLNGEESVYSPVSSPEPKPIYNFVKNGKYTIPRNTYETFYNAVKVTIPILDLYSETEDIYKVNLLFRSSSTNNWYLVKTFVFNPASERFTNINYIFNGSTKLIPQDQESVNRAYDLVPEKANDLTVLNNRIFDTGITEGKDIIRDEDLSVKVEEDTLPVDISNSSAKNIDLYLRGKLNLNESPPERDNSSDMDDLADISKGFSLGSDFPDTYVYYSSDNYRLLNNPSNDLTYGIAPNKIKFKIGNINSKNYIDISFTTRIKLQLGNSGKDIGGTDVGFRFQFTRNSTKSNSENITDLSASLVQAIEDYHSELNAVFDNYNDAEGRIQFETDENIGEYPQIKGVTTNVTGEDDLEALAYYETHVNFTNTNTLDKSPVVVMTLLDKPTELFTEVGSGSTFNESTDGQVLYYFDDPGSSVYRHYYSPIFINLFFLEKTGTASQYQHFKNGFNLKLGIRYFDEYGRYSFDLSNESMSITPLNAKLERSGNISQIKYSIDHKAPLWAKYYAITAAKRRPEFEYYWVYIPEGNMTDDNMYEDDVSYSIDGGEVSVKIYNNYIADDIGNTKSRSWEFVKGDRVRISQLQARGSDGGGWDKKFFIGDDYYDYDFEISSLGEEEYTDSGNTKTFTVLKFNVNDNSLASLSNLLNLTGSNSTSLWDIVFELYRPQDETEDVLFYEITDRFPCIDGYHSNGYDRSGGGILDESRQSDTTPAEGYIENGTVWFRNKVFGKSYGTSGAETVVESLFISDHNDSWDTKFDKPGIEANEYSNENKEYAITRWTNPYVRNLNINGLSSNLSGSYVYHNLQYGKARAIENFGDTLVVFQDRKITSYYAGKRQVFNGDGSSQLVATDEVVSTPNPRIEDYGTIYKHSVERDDRSIYFFDVYNRCMCRYAANGIQNISSGQDIQSPEYNYKMGKYFKDKSNEILSVGVENVQVISTYSEQYDILFVTFRSDEDGFNDETIGFHAPSAKWISFYSFTPEMYGKYAEVFCSFKNGMLYKHGEGNRLYGETIQSEFDLVVNEVANKKKVFDFIRLHSNKALDTTIETNPTSIYPRGQYSEINSDLYEMYEGQYESDFLSNMRDNRGNETYELLYDGDRIRDYAAHIKISGTDLEIFGVDIGLTYS